MLIKIYKNEDGLDEAFLVETYFDEREKTHQRILESVGLWDDIKEQYSGLKDSKIIDLLLKDQKDYTPNTELLHRQIDDEDSNALRVNYIEKFIDLTLDKFGIKKLINSYPKIDGINHQLSDIFTSLLFDKLVENIPGNDNEYLTSYSKIDSNSLKPFYQNFGQFSKLKDTICKNFSQEADKKSLCFVGMGSANFYLKNNIKPRDLDSTVEDSGLKTTDPTPKLITMEKEESSIDNNENNEEQYNVDFDFNNDKYESGMNIDDYEGLSQDEIESRRQTNYSDFEDFDKINNTVKPAKKGKKKLEEKNLEDFLNEERELTENAKTPILLNFILDDHDKILYYDFYNKEKQQEEDYYQFLDDYKTLFNISRLVLVDYDEKKTKVKLSSLVQNGYGYLTFKSIDTVSANLKELILSDEGYTFNNNKSEKTKSISIFRDEIGEINAMDLEIYQQQNMVYWEEKIVIHWSKEQFERDAIRHMEERKLFKPYFKNPKLTARKVKAKYMKYFVINEVEAISKKKNAKDYYYKFDQELFEADTKYSGYILYSTSEVKLDNDEIISNYFINTKIKEIYDYLPTGINSYPIEDRTIMDIKTHFLLLYLSHNILTFFQEIIYRWGYSYKLTNIKLAINTAGISQINSEYYLLQPLSDVVYKLIKYYRVENFFNCHNFPIARLQKFLKLKYINQDNEPD